MARARNSLRGSTLRGLLVGTPPSREAQLHEQKKPVVFYLTAKIAYGVGSSNKPWDTLFWSMQNPWIAPLELFILKAVP